MRAATLGSASVHRRITLPLVTGLLSAFLLFTLPGRLLAQGCPLPPEYTHARSVTVGDMVITLASEQGLYAVGDPITFRLSFENTGTTTQYIPNPNAIDPPLMIALLPAECGSLNDDGCYPDGAWVYRHPEGWFFFGTPIPVAPGECYIRTAAWDGVTHQGGSTPAGLYTAFGGGFDGGSFLLPAGGVQLPIVIGAVSEVTPPPPETWGRLKTLYPGSERPIE
jgi:hypothetical protein